MCTRSYRPDYPAELFAIPGNTDAPKRSSTRSRHRQRSSGTSAWRNISRWWWQPMAACLNCRMPSSIRTSHISATSRSSRRCAMAQWICGCRSSGALVRSRAFLSRSEARAEEQRRASVVDLRTGECRAADRRDREAFLQRRGRQLLAAGAALGRDARIAICRFHCRKSARRLSSSIAVGPGQSDRLLDTWSAVQRYKRATGEDPLPALRAEIAPCWGSPVAVKTVTWPLHLRVGRAN